MEDSNVTTQTQGTPSLGTRIANVFAAPGEAFEGLKDQSPKTSLWLLPYLLLIMFSVVFTYVIFVNEPLKDQIFDMQTRAFDEQVEKGQMTRQQADQFRERMQQTGLGLFMVFGTVPQIVFISIYYFGAALFLWLVAKLAWKSQEKYRTFLEVYGLASWVGVLGYVITILMVMSMNDIFATPSLRFVLSENYDPFDTGHKFLSAINAFSIWQAGVTGVGLGQVTGKSPGSGIGVAIGLWIVWVAVGVPLGLVR